MVAGGVRRQDIDTWIFDLDNTLYPAASDLFHQIDRRIHDYIESFLAIDQKTAADLKRRYYLEYGSSMRGLMIHHAMPPDDFLDFVHDIDFAPLDPNPRLRDAIAMRPTRYPVEPPPWLMQISSCGWRSITPP